MKRFIKEYANYRKSEFASDYKQNPNSMHQYIVSRYSMEKCNKIVAAYEAGTITTNEAMRTLSNIGYFEE